ncbi:MAG: hiran domain protein [Chlorobi bacterium]|nr:hiran domain protein [Chlorobiota bacterium]
MKRRHFLKIIGGALAGISLGFRPKAKKPSVVRERVSIYKAHLRGLAYYDYQKVKTQLHPGDKLILKREPENPYDADAIAVYFGKHKLGYLPAVENAVMARMLDEGLVLTAKVTAHSGKPYREVEAEVFFHPGEKSPDHPDLPASATAGLLKLNEQKKAWPRIEDEANEFPYC